MLCLVFCLLSGLQLHQLTPSRFQGEPLRPSFSLSLFLLFRSLKCGCGCVLRCVPMQPAPTLKFVRLVALSALMVTSPQIFVCDQFLVLKPSDSLFRNQLGQVSVSPNRLTCFYWMLRMHQVLCCFFLCRDPAVLTQSEHRRQLSQPFPIQLAAAGCAAQTETVMDRSQGGITKRTNIFNFEFSQPPCTTNCTIRCHPA